MREHYQGEQYLNIANINLLIRFNKKRETFTCIIRVLIILPKTAATNAIVEKAF